MDEVRCLQASNAILGEGPSWETGRKLLWWVDIKRPAVFSYDPLQGQTGIWPLPLPVGCAVPAADGSLIVADTAGFAQLDPETGMLTRIGDPEPDSPGNRFNDGKVDRAGRLWAGTIDDRCIEPTGHLYRLDSDLSIHRMDSGFICSNGIGWSPDNRTMYFVDSMVRTIWSYEYDLASGHLGTRRAFARLADDDGVPDGLTVDAEGGVWVAIWDGWRIVRYASDGSIDREIATPVQRPTSCMFGGADLKTLFITSAAIDLDHVTLCNGPLAGALFALEPGVAGIPEVRFGEQIISGGGHA